MKDVRLESKKQKRVKILSKILYIFACIGKVFCYVALPFIVLAIVIIPMLLNKIEIKDNKIKVKNTDDFVSLVEKDDKLIIEAKGSKIAEVTEMNDIEKVKEVFNYDLKKTILVYSEIALVFALISIILSIIILRHVEKLFKNISRESTPFTMDNVGHIKRIAIVLIINIIIPVVFDFVFGIVSNGKIDANLKTSNLFEILGLFVLAYIFEYGYKLQSKSKLTIYDEYEAK